MIYSIKLGAVVAVAYFLGIYVSAWTPPILKEIGGLWSVISGILVLKQGSIETFKSGFGRVLGTFIGSLVGGLFLYFIENIWFFPLAIALTTFLCISTSRLKGYYTHACIACSVVVIIWQIDPKPTIWLYSFSRFLDSVVGVVSALIIVHIPPYSSKGKTA